MECRETPSKLVPSAVVRCLTPTKDLETFDDLRLAAFNSNSLKMNFEKIPFTSAKARGIHVLSTTAVDTSPTLRWFRKEHRVVGFTFVKKQD